MFKETNPNAGHSEQSSPDTGRFSAPQNYDSDFIFISILTKGFSQNLVFGEWS
jgi:hypothetical protein